MFTEKNARITVRAIGAVEVKNGLSIFLGLLVQSLATSFNRLPSIYIFVMITSAISFVIGLGLLRRRGWARRLLVFFAGYIIVTKILLVTKLLTFSGNTVDFLSVNVKDLISFIYHGIILVLFNQPVIKKSLG